MQSSDQAAEASTDSCEQVLVPDFVLVGDEYAGLRQVATGIVKETRRLETLLEEHKGEEGENLSFMGVPLDLYSSCFTVREVGHEVVKHIRQLISEVEALGPSKATEGVRDLLAVEGFFCFCLTAFL
uniref:Uncharacterized protein n=1 Tax=Chromera velia CCMP2878 TaxID=1169474 RepID=A0A0G4G3W8_9ALVE|mmetsp:Transcript_45265/g.89206  ORF Transcript_45265/g.89206 Transcript_45265/m.89206 type:complete len:127 (+) Transcript_45265:45-425(+)|eukprot:Cvel_20165.t1-p1 / transcript=Cvel_20165.t1 / gene=Cvel_20165 / organism=Chromera_velia_CCMP2878 / gene_product=hypothetical protein / transcript_product=hypothetical protein / location=Cvel_scaffold1791:26172-26549(-) / protein_length=126 / sequence_SO=supercontig / SO=protein_coding / is_pseudo=false